MSRVFGTIFFSVGACFPQSCCVAISWGEFVFIKGADNKILNVPNFVKKKTPNNINLQVFSKVKKLKACVCLVFVYDVSTSYS